jgi:hypothetical protein
MGIELMIAVRRYGDIRLKSLFSTYLWPGFLRFLLWIISNCVTATGITHAHSYVFTDVLGLTIFVQSSPTETSLNPACSSLQFDVLWVWFTKPTTHPVIAVRAFSIRRRGTKACRSRNRQVCSSLTSSGLFDSPSFYVIFFLPVKALCLRICLRVTYISFWSSGDLRNYCLRMNWVKECQIVPLYFEQVAWEGVMEQVLPVQLL